MQYITPNSTPTKLESMKVDMKESGHFYIFKCEKLPPDNVPTRSVFQPLWEKPFPSQRHNTFCICHPVNLTMNPVGLFSGPAAGLNCPAWSLCVVFCSVPATGRILEQVGRWEMGLVLISQLAGGITEKLNLEQPSSSLSLLVFHSTSFSWAELIIAW